jgi:hypothetical protein
VKRTSHIVTEVVVLLQQERVDRVRNDERGMALALAIFALVVVGALVASAFFTATQEQRVGENTRRLEQAFGVAEYGIANKMLTWDPAALNTDLGPYPTDSAAISFTTTATGTGSYGGWVYKLTDDVFMLDVVGMDTMTRSGRVYGGGARQRLGLVTRLRPLEVDVQASLTTQGSVTLQGNAQVDGTDTPPTGWLGCGTPGPSQAGVRTDGGTVKTGGNAVVIGDPKIKNDTSLADSTFTQFGDIDWADLVSDATIKLPPGTYTTQPSFSGGVCNKADQQNWGDGTNPSSACGGYFPIIYISGDAILNGVQGQGILLVDGTLSVQGSYEFYGIAIMQGDLKTAGGGSTEAHFWGGTMSKNADLSVQNLSGKATLNYSSCALNRALRASARPAMMRSRGWVQLY